MSDPKVLIVMGSDSDLAVMKGAADALDEFGIAYEVHISSAHRVPEKTADLAKNAKDRGIEVIIAGAGGAAHLPGVMAAVTPLPVIGIPIKTPTVGGVDSLYAIVQMPAGIPVATVAINGAKNAGLLAVQIMAVKDAGLSDKFVAYKAKMGEKVEKKDTMLQEKGISVYLADM